MNTVIVGLGAIGSIYAVALKKAGLPVRIALDLARRERYANEPFIFNGQEVAFDYFTPDSSSQSADLVIVATKWNGYTEALELIRPIVTTKTIILPLLNGINSEEVAAQYFSPENVLYGYFIGHTATRIGRSIDQDGSYVTVFGDMNNDLEKLSPKVLALKELFDLAGVKYRIDNDMIASLWQKFIINIGLNQVTAIYRKPYGQIRVDAKALAFTSELMNEAAAIATHIGINGADKMVEKGLETLGKMRPEDSSSMLQDVEAGRVTEVEIFAGQVCRLGRLYRIATPKNQMVLDKLM